MCPVESSPSDQERRACQRIHLSYPAILETAGGVAIQGNTEDISLGGLRLHSQDDLAQVRAGEMARLSLLLHDGTRSEAYPCVVNRVGAGTLGLALDRSCAAAFGKRLTQGMFRR